MDLIARMLTPSEEDTLLDLLETGVAGWVTMDAMIFLSCAANSGELRSIWLADACDA
jgi:hypothetical protein